MAILTPHFDLPFKFGAVVEQGTVQDLANCVYAIVVCPTGFRDLVPDFGTSDLAFTPQPVMNDKVSTAIADQEPRAEMYFSEQGIYGDSELSRAVRIAVEQRRSP